MRVYWYLYGVQQVRSIDMNKKERSGDSQPGASHAKV